MLALALGMPVREMLTRMPAGELTEWMAYYQLEPFGAVRADARSAIIASTVANTVRDAKKRKRPYEPSEFLPKFGAQKEKSAADLLGIARMINASLGGVTKRVD